MKIEQEYLDAGHAVIVGMDEAGYGAWAGPVAAAAVCLPLTDDTLPGSLRGVKDSKQMTPLQRTRAYDVIKEVALGYGIGHAEPDEINAHGLAHALRLAFERAYMQCTEMLAETKVEVLLIDGKTTWRTCPYQDDLTFKQIPNGDAVALSIAAASVLAKVWRDQQMIDMGAEFPAYGFERHKGYGTKAHQSALEAHGVLRGIHRTAYKPVAALLP